MSDINLFYRDGSSDKVYQIQIAPIGDLFVVNFQFGRRGTALQTGSKTTSPVSLSKAEQIFDKLVAEKQAKGYSISESGTPYQATTKEERVSDLDFPFDQLDRAYKAGIKAGKSGAGRDANPYHRVSAGFTMKIKLRESWGRGWMRGKMIKGRR